MPNGSIIELNCIQTLGNTRFTNVFYVQQTSSDPSVTDYRKAAADAFKAAYFDTLAPFVSDKWNLLCIEAKDIGITGVIPWRENYTLAGSNGAEALPSHQCAIITWNTTNGGRGRTCKAYVSGATVADEAQNNLTEAFGNNLSTVGEKLTQSITNGVEGTSYRAGPRNPHGVEWEPFVIHDVRSPYTRVSNRRADTRC